MNRYTKSVVLILLVLLLWISVFPVLAYDADRIAVSQVNELATPMSISEYSVEDLFTSEYGLYLYNDLDNRLYERMQLELTDAYVSSNLFSYSLYWSVGKLGSSLSTILKETAHMMSPDLPGYYETRLQETTKKLILSFMDYDDGMKIALKKFESEYKFAKDLYSVIESINAEFDKSDTDVRKIRTLVEAFTPIAPADIERLADSVDKNSAAIMENTLEVIGYGVDAGQLFVSILSSYVVDYIIVDRLLELTGSNTALHEGLIDFKNSRSMMFVDNALNYILKLVYEKFAAEALIAWLTPTMSGTMKLVSAGLSLFRLAVDQFYTVPKPEDILDFEIMRGFELVLGNARSSLIQKLRNTTNSTELDELRNDIELIVNIRKVAMGNALDYAIKWSNDETSSLEFSTWKTFIESDYSFEDYLNLCVRTLNKQPISFNDITVENTSNLVEFGDIIEIMGNVASITKVGGQQLFLPVFDHSLVGGIELSGEMYIYSTLRIPSVEVVAMHGNPKIHALSPTVPIIDRLKIMDGPGGSFIIDGYNLTIDQLDLDPSTSLISDLKGTLTLVQDLVLQGNKSIVSWQGNMVFSGDLILGNYAALGVGTGTTTIKGDFRQQHLEKVDENLTYHTTNSQLSIYHPDSKLIVFGNYYYGSLPSTYPRDGSIELKGNFIQTGVGSHYFLAPRTLDMIFSGEEQQLISIENTQNSILGNFIQVNPNIESTSGFSVQGVGSDVIFQGLIGGFESIDTIENTIVFNSDFVPISRTLLDLGTNGQIIVNGSLDTSKSPLTIINLNLGSRIHIQKNMIVSNKTNVAITGGELVINGDLSIVNLRPYYGFSISLEQQSYLRVDGNLDIQVVYDNQLSFWVGTAELFGNFDYVGPALSMSKPFVTIFNGIKTQSITTSPLTVCFGTLIQLNPLIELYSDLRSLQIASNLRIGGNPNGLILTSWNNYTVSMIDRPTGFFTNLPTNYEIVTDTLTEYSVLYRPFNNVFEVEYMIDGVVAQTILVPEGNSISDQEAPAKSGYIFVGWAVQQANSPVNDYWDFNNNIYSNMILTAIYEPIDKQAPSITIQPYITELTNLDITVLATTDKGQLNETSHVFTTNGTYTFIATDAYGNTSSTDVVITNIDKSPPVVTGVYNGVFNQTLVITYSDGVALLNGLSIESGFELSQEGAYKLTVSDILGNTTVINFQIDKTAPIIDVIGEVFEPTSRDVTVFAKTNEGQLNAKAHTFTQNGTFTFIATDNAGNVTERVVTVNQINKRLPMLTGVEHNKFYNESLTISYDFPNALLNGIAFVSGGVVSVEGFYILYLFDYAGNQQVINFTLDKTAPVITVDDYSTLPTNQNVTVTVSTSEGTLNAISHTFTENGSFTFIAADLAGNVTQQTVTVTHIDKVSPTITIAPYTTEPTNQEVVVTASTNEGTLNTTSHTFSTNGSFTFIATDLAGNITEKTVNITHIVSPTQVKTISISQLPTTLNYIQGVELDPTGGQLQVTTFEGNNLIIDIILDMLSGYDPYSPIYGPQTVTVTYQGVTTSLEVYLNRFIDVPYGHRNYVHINALVGLGIINGYSDNTFRPNNTLTRAQAAIMIVRAIGLSTDGVSSSFTDVPPTHAAYKFISAAYQAGIINGYSDGTFRPNANVTRAQIAIMVQRAFNVQASSTVITFTDVPEGYAPKKFIETLASQKIVNGYSDGTFKPLNNVTRAQFSTMIYNAIQYAQKTE